MFTDTDTQLSQLELKCRRPVEHLLAGEYHSVFRGQGIEFEDVRAYQPGDDIRSMDWKVTARTGEPYIKRYIEEREQFLYLLVDLSASLLSDQPNQKNNQEVGLRRKTMAELCSLLTMAAIKNNDRVALLLFTDQVELLIPPGKGRSHALRIMDALLNFIPQNQGTGFESVLSRFGHIARKHSVAFVISDFLADGYLEEMRALAARHDINAVNLLDPRVSLDQVTEILNVRDAESRQRRFLDLRHQDSDQDITGARAHQLQLQEDMLHSGIDLMEIQAGEDCVQALTSFFHTRQRRVADETGG